MKKLIAGVMFLLCSLSASAVDKALVCLFNADGQATNAITNETECIDNGELYVRNTFTVQSGSPLCSNPRWATYWDSNSQIGLHLTFYDGPAAHPCPVGSETDLSIGYIRASSSTTVEPNSAGLGWGYTIANYTGN